MPGLFDDVLGPKVAKGGLFDDVLTGDQFANVIGSADTVPLQIPERSLGDFGSDAATRVRQGLNTVVGGLVGAPVNIANLVTQPMRMAQRGGNALRDALGMEALPEFGVLQQPEVVQGMRESLGINNAEEDQQLSATARAQAQGFQKANGILPALSYLAEHPSYAATEAAAQLPQFLQLMPGSVLGTIALQGTGAAAQNTQQIEDTLRADGASEDTIAARGAAAFGPSLALNTVLPYAIPGGSAIERLLAGQAGKGAVREGTSKLAQVVTSTLGEIGTEGAQEGVDQVIQNIATDRPIGEQVGQNVALGALIGAPGGLAAGGVDVLRQPIATPVNPDTAPDTSIDVAAGNALLNPVGPAPSPADALKARTQAGLDRASPVLGQAEDTSDLDALIMAHLPPEVVQQAQQATMQQKSDALATLGELTGEAAPVDPDAPYRRPEPAAATPTETPSPQGFIQQAAEAMNQQASRTAAQSAQSPAAPVGSRPAGGDLQASQATAANKADAQNGQPNAQSGQVADGVSSQPTMFTSGKSVQAVRLADGSYKIRKRLAGQWQKWEKAGPKFEPTPGLFRQHFPQRGTVTIDGEKIVVGEKQAPLPKTAKKIPHLLDAIAHVGLNREAFRAQGVDPAAMTQRSGGKYVFRKDGGMTLDGLREMLQQDGYLARDPENGVVTVDDNDALDVLMRALGGEEIHNEHQSDAVAQRDYERRAEQEQFDADLADQHPDIADKDYDAATRLAAVVARARAAGVDEFDIGPYSDEADTDYIARLEQEIAHQEARRGTDNRPDEANRGERLQRDAEGPGFALDNPARAEAPRQVASSGLFAPPTRGEQVNAAAEQKDASRNGLGRDLVRPEQGAGELLAGEKPVQTEVPESDGYDTMPIDELRLSAMERGIKHTAAMGRARLAAELRGKDLARKIRSTNDDRAAADWRDSVADLKGKQPWEMTREEWSRARSLVQSGIDNAKGLEMTGLDRATKAFEDFFGYRPSPRGNARHEVAVLHALEKGEPVPENVRAEYRGNDDAFRYERKSGDAMQRMLAKDEPASTQLQSDVEQAGKAKAAALENVEPAKPDGVEGRDYVTIKGNAGNTIYARHESSSPDGQMGERWYSDRGAMTGEPIAFLDGDNEDDATAAVVAEEVSDNPRFTYYRAAAPDGETIGEFGTPAEAARAAEARFPEQAQEIDTSQLTPAEQEAYDRANNTSEAKKKAAALSQAQGEADAHARGFHEAIQSVLGDQANRVEYVRDYKGLPDELRSGVEARNADRRGNIATAAIYDPVSKRVFLITSVVKTADRAAFNAAHEIAGHDGLRKLLGNKLDPALTIALQNPTVKALADAIMADRSMDKGQKLLAAEEALAELAAAVRTGDYAHIQSRYGVEVGDGIRTQQSLKAAIANFLKRLKALLNSAFGKDAFTDQDVRSLLDAALDASRSESIGQPQGLLESTNPAKPSILENVEDSRTLAEIRREQAAQTLPVARGAAGWNYDSGKWEGRRGQANAARTHLQDKMLAWRDVQGQIESQLQAVIPDAQNVYRLENLMHGRVSEGIDMIEREQVKPLMEAMRAAKVLPATLEEYMYARHATERNAQIASINPAMPDGGSGMTNAEAAKALTGADKAVLEPLAKRVDAITKATRKRLLAHGLITQEAFDAMEAQYRHYVPLRGKATAESADFGGSGTAGRGLDSRGKPVKQALGRGAGNKAQHILGEVIGDAERSVILAEKARVGRAVMRLVLANPNPSLWQVEPVQTERALDAAGEVYEKVVNDWSDPSVIAVRHKGQLFRVQINSVPLAQALNNVGVDQIGTVTRIAGAVNRYFSAILTKYNPAFIPVNATRDALFGLTGMAAEHGELAALDAALHYLPAASAAFQHARGKRLAGEWGEWAAEFAEHGGKTGYVNLPSAEDIARKIGNGKLSGYTPDGLRKVARVLGDAVGVLNDAVENALRLSAYVTLRKRGSSPDAAAAYAKDITVNFNRKGFDGSKLNAWFLFYNASMQGGHRVSKLLRKPKTYAYLGMLAGAQVVATLAAMAMHDDDGEPLWNKVPDHVKRRNLVIATPDGTLYTIPMPYGFNLFTYMSGRIAESIANGNRGDKRASDTAAQLTADAISAATQSFSPVPLDTGPIGLVPNLLRIPLNLWANRNDFGGKIRDEVPYAKSDVPRASMGRPDTLEIFKLSAKGLNRVGGGDDLTPPPLSMFDVAPEDIEYLLKELTGGPGQLITEIATSGQKATGGEFAQDLAARDIPIAKRFRSNIDEQAAQQALFYDRREVVDRSLKRVRIAFKTKGAAAAEQLLAASPELKGAGFKRRKGEGRHGEAPGSIILVDGNPQIVAIDENQNRGTGHPVSNPSALSVFGAYKAAEKAISTRSENVETAFSVAPASILPTNATRERDASIRTENRIRQAAQAEFNSAWVRDVVGSAE